MAGVPLAAVEFSIQDEIVASHGPIEEEAPGESAATVTLTGTAPTPYFAGFKIHATGLPAGRGPCSMGPVVRINSSTNGFITASHCTDQIFSNDGNTHFQPTLSGNLLGTEHKDQTGISHPSCPPTSLCRKSDAAIVKFSSASMGARGHIARVTGIGSKTLTSTPDDEWLVTDDTPPCALFVQNCWPPIVGKTMNYVGQQSGWRQGTLIRSCVITQYSIGGQNISVICIDEIQGPTGGGDSGAIVFELTNDPREVDLWRINTSKSGGSWFMSRIEAVKQEVPGFNAKADPILY
ncbi:MAG: S1 family peptidase [Gemmatimonadetes bacterium]|nr:S1 family peptidase [Gemmatimonadota bacterium]